MSACTFPACGCVDPCGVLNSETPAELLARVNTEVEAGRPQAATHEALLADFVHCLTDYVEDCGPLVLATDVDMLAARLVHLVVLHGLLPEVE